ncbi:double-strand break repair helicase AddA [Sulfitobacter sp. JL08]|uniref:double-strand break repair helicase AddA n=1 Tax=Sulfitobacter sp. JL08 TaxID=2070369 RepID=UPI000E0B8E2C|nr:double-strand break repair helicase AddA [Sulfitobacter sp. JL08]AXI56611.1 double-strand break repair helicase AddA [Sulfitobacter sp. JL08]
MRRNEATERQVQAANPVESTWLAANAGSGKTRVLTDRVARLLLNNVQPQHILCLTYTKAAASEMQNRLFGRLGEWAMLQDAPLRAALLDLGLEGTLDTERLRSARTLFARAIEAPGGLKIQTIHSFCSSLLRRFPLEAGVSPQFAEIEDRAAALLRAEIVDELAEADVDGCVSKVAQHFTGEDFTKLTDEIVRNRDLFQAGVKFKDLLGLFGLPADTTEDTVLASVMLGSEQLLLDALIGPLLNSSTNDQKTGRLLQSVTRLDWSALPVLESAFLLKKSPFSAKLGTVPTKPRQKDLAHVMPELDALMQRVERGRQMRLGLMAARRTQALYTFARQFLPTYDMRKQQRGWLDFDDLIMKARQLLRDSDVAQWVLYRLDGGIDHILVDEAQDTSPAQWDVIEKLAQEFTSGQGARTDATRTIFVVGDKKQSIYSFQGADPNEFDRMQNEFKARLNGVGLALQDLTLEHSFRSSEAILWLVDKTFDAQGAAGFSKDALHKAFKTDLPGRVDLWPVVEKSDESEERAWYDPLDQKSEKHHTVVLAEQIARTIRGMIDDQTVIPDETKGAFTGAGRLVRPGDFLILVQRRSALFHEIIRACKGQNLPIAGADRLRVGAETAVKDLGALLSFLATPEDDLALATALRSPLFGWSEQNLFSLSHRRTTHFLWQALREKPETYPETLAILQDLRDQTDFLRPYDLIERILTRHKGRKNLLARLGHEAEDGIDALLSQALSYERNSVPSLTGFLVWMQTDDLDIKRQMDGASNQIRVMTVHGAKGLEAPIVILPETARYAPPLRKEIIPVGQHAIWKTAADTAPEVLTSALDDLKNAELNERLRLLYVAMTRAEKWLIVAAAGELTKDDSSWYEMIQNAMKQAGAVSHDFEGGQGLRLSHGDWAGLRIETEDETDTPDPVLEAFFETPVPTLPPAHKTISPSDLGGAKALPGDAGADEESALKKGRQIHLLLEHLEDIAPAQRAALAAQLLQNGPDAATPEDAPGLIGEALNVLSEENLSGVFTRSALREVPVTAELGRHRLHGTIDRLIVADDRVTAIDFKTNATAPGTASEVPEGILRQLGAYAHALSQVFPGREIETAILWTATPTLMRLPHDLVTDALKRTPYLDDASAAT